MANKENLLQYNPAIPYHGDAFLLTAFTGVLGPYSYTGWRHETMAWKEGA
ncbi:MAG: hypothetical protein QHH06_05985 [Clostridiales bacterium]|jgi:hypothetical protein|nr:hypothetical protein [Eubacteriales bacterium]MDH7566013.1 hypothetical protein [Clostridiales bacterium]